MAQIIKVGDKVRHTGTKEIYIVGMIMGSQANTTYLCAPEEKANDKDYPGISFDGDDLELFTE